MSEPITIREHCIDRIIYGTKVNTCEIDGSECAVCRLVTERVALLDCLKSYIECDGFDHIDVDSARVVEQVYGPVENWSGRRRPEWFEEAGG